MIISEHPFMNKDNLIRHYSDANKMIEQVETGNRYEEAVDVYPCGYHYTEAEEDIPIMEEDAPEIEEDAPEINDAGPH